MAKKIVRFPHKNRVEIRRDKSCTIGLFPDKDEVEIAIGFEFAEFSSERVARCFAFSAGPTSQKAMNNCTYRSTRMAIVAGLFLERCSINAAMDFSRC
jgi:hypothetical protein